VGVSQAHPEFSRLAFLVYLMDIEGAKGGESKLRTVGICITIKFKYLFSFNPSLGCLTNIIVSSFMVRVRADRQLPDNTREFRIKRYNTLTFKIIKHEI
jgi:hypothetical protein